MRDLLTDDEVRMLTFVGTDEEILTFRAGFRARIEAMKSFETDVHAWETAKRMGAPDAQGMNLYPTQHERVSWQKGWMGAHAMLSVLVADATDPDVQRRIREEDEREKRDVFRFEEGSLEDFLKSEK